MLSRDDTSKWTLTKKCFERESNETKNQTFVENIYVFLYLLGNIGAGWRVWRKMNEKASVEIYQRKSAFVQRKGK